MDKTICTFHISDDINCWLEQLQHTFRAQKITDKDDKKSIILSNISTDAFKDIRAKVFPKNLLDVPLDDVVDALKECYTSSVNQIALRCMFYKRLQLQHESASEYALALKKLSLLCGYKDTLEDNLRDRFVSGIICKNTRMELLNIPELT